MGGGGGGGGVDCRRGHDGARATINPVDVLLRGWAGAFTANREGPRWLAASAAAHPALTATLLAAAPSLLWDLCRMRRRRPPRPAPSAPPPLALSRTCGHRR